MTEQVTSITDVPKTSKTKQFLADRKKALTATALLLGGAAVFVLGRQSKNVVESVDVDVDVHTPDES